MIPAFDRAGDDEPCVVVDALVAVTLDDLDAGHLNVESALRAIAMAAWNAGRATAPTF